MDENGGNVERRKEVVTYKQVADLVRDHEKTQTEQFERLYDKLDENIKEQRIRDERQDERLLKVENRVCSIEERHEKKDEERKSEKANRVKLIFWAAGILVTTGAAGAILRFIFRIPLLTGGTP